MIIVSKKEIPLNFGLLHGFLSLWNTSVNAFVLSFSMISSMLHDVAAIVGLLMDGDEIPFLREMLGNDLGFQVNKNKNAYSTFINTFNGGSGLVGETEHKAFLIFWIYCFFIYTSSMVVVEKFTPYVIAILN